MADDTEAKAVDGRAFPFAPATLVLARDPTLPEATRDAVTQLTSLVAEGNKEEAHRLVAPLSDDAKTLGAVAWFYVRELSGRRGARRLLRWLRQEPTRSDADRIFTAWAGPALESWAHFRLLRHGRALTIARDAVKQLTATGGSGGGAEDRANEARTWGQALEAIARCALRRGNLRLALNFHELAEELVKKHPGCLPDADASRKTMTAVVYLLELHREHGLPSSLARYLARSLGHDEGDSPTAYAELVGDLSLRPEHLDSGLGVASRFGFGQRVAAPLQKVRDRLFTGNWRLRRGVQRGVLIGVYVLAAVLILFGFVLLANVVSR